MKYTYLYPLQDTEVWLWRAARSSAADLFGHPEVDESTDREWVLQSRLADSFGEIRDELHRRLESRPHICIGEQYVIPASQDEVSRSRERDADRIVQDVTEALWDAPYFHGHVYAYVFGLLRTSAGQNGRDDEAEIVAFLQAHRCTKANGKRIRVVPVWM